MAPFENREIEIVCGDAKFTITLHSWRYENNDSLAIMAYCADGTRYDNLTVNIPEIDLEDDEITVPMWGHHEMWIKQVLNQLSDVFIDTGKRVKIGNLACEAHIWRVSESFEELSLKEIKRMYPR